MRKGVIWMIVGFAMFVGCRSYMSYGRHSSSDIPFDKRKPPSLNKAVIISTNGPQLGPTYYQTMGRVRSKIENVSAFQNHCKDAIEMLRYEAEVAGADALMNVSCSPDNYGAAAYGTAITFYDRDQAFEVLRNIKANLE